MIGIMVHSVSMFRLLDVPNFGCKTGALIEGRKRYRLRWIVEEIATRRSRAATLKLGKKSSVDSNVVSFPRANVARLAA